MSMPGTPTPHCQGPQVFAGAWHGQGGETPFQHRWGTTACWVFLWQTQIRAWVSSQQPLQVTFAICFLLFGKLLNFCSGLLLEMSTVVAGNSEGLFPWGLLLVPWMGQQKARPSHRKLCSSLFCVNPNSCSQIPAFRSAVTQWCYFAVHSHGTEPDPANLRAVNMPWILKGVVWLWGMWSFHYQLCQLPAGLTAQPTTIKQHLIIRGSQAHRETCFGICPFMT